VLGRLSRLAGAQHDAYVLVAELVADVVDELQPGLVALHDHVEQDHGDVVVLGQLFLGLLGGHRRKDVERAVLESEVAEDEAGDLVYLWLIVYE
jgi:hypothetical protein